MRLIDGEIFLLRMAKLYITKGWDMEEAHFSLSDLICNIDQEKAVRLEDLLNGDGKEHIEVNLFDEEEIHENCTVQVLRNSYTGVVSVGWWENE